MDYIWQSEMFPKFEFSKQKIIPIIQKFAHDLGEFNGMVIGFPQELKLNLFAEILVSEAIETSGIEGEYFSRDDVMSSLKANLGIKNYHEKSRNKKANAIAHLMIEIQKNYQIPMSEELLLRWHHILMENEKGISAGKFRKGTEPMQVVSGKFGDFTIHYEAPSSKDLPKMIVEFVRWYNNFVDVDLGKIGEGIVLSALAHLYFETLHPFEDGNGRIGRALAEKTLSEKFDAPIYISISKSIQKDKQRYYNELKTAQRNLHIDSWMRYFCHILQDALLDSKKVVLFTLKKTAFFDLYQHQVNERQLKAINKMMEMGENSFIGGMSSKKYISINKTSKATATRDLQHLVEIGAFLKMGNGRSVAYEINYEK
ncbi:Fic family protein [Chryseobacterium sp.]|uniref:Fic family protein n=1 Tax=Chryseobacterium sp. TaxID=1871047 RepID=UPI003890AB9E